MANKRSFPPRAILVGPTLSAKDARKFKLRFPIRETDLVIGVDAGGAVALTLGLRPEVVIGDLDSLPRVRGGLSAVKGVPQIRLRADKDQSDLFYAIRFAHHWGAKELLCIGVTGGARLDHHLAGLYDLAEAADSGAFTEVTAIGPDGRHDLVTPRTGPLRLRGLARGTVVSILPIGKGPVSGVKTRGFAYAAPGGVYPFSSRGISNVVVGTKSDCTVRVGRGRLVITTPHDGT